MLYHHTYLYHLCRYLLGIYIVLQVRVKAYITKIVFDTIVVDVLGRALYQDPQSVPQNGEGGDQNDAGEQQRANRIHNLDGEKHSR